MQPGATLTPEQQMRWSWPSTPCRQQKPGNTRLVMRGRLAHRPALYYLLLMGLRSSREGSRGLQDRA